MLANTRRTRPKEDGKVSAVGVRALDVVALLHNAVLRDEFVVVKIDVEGAEYELLHALLADEQSPSACSLIDVMLLEFHGMQFVDVAASPRLALEAKFGATLEELESTFVKELRVCGVDVRTNFGITD